MEELLRKRTRTQMEDAIRELPTGLTALYDRMLLQIDPRYRPTCSKILRWVAFAARPLSTDELGAVINLVSPGPVTVQQDISDQLTLCGSLIKITDNIVSLVHESAREYLSLVRYHGTTSLEDFRCQPHATHLEMAIDCLAYIEQ